MAEGKGKQYDDAVGKFHLAKEGIKEKWSNFKEGQAGERANEFKEDVIKKINKGDEAYDHLYRRKDRWELTKISAAVMGIEFAYAAETAFVSPTLLKIGVLHKHMTLIWCLSPMVGFFLTPLMGSLSDRCKSNLGRRRPFIILLSVGVVLGLILVPNGKLIGKMLGDQYPLEDALAAQRAAKEGKDGPGGRFLGNDYDYDRRQQSPAILNTTSIFSNEAPVEPPIDDPSNVHGDHPWGIFFTVLGTVLLDFDADACQSPSRAYLLDVTVAEDHAVGLSTFTIMAGLGGSFGYMMGGFDWGALGDLFGGHVRLVFTLVLFIYLFCVFFTLTSFSEMPLSTLEETASKGPKKSKSYTAFVGEGDSHEMEKLNKKYGSTDEGNGEDVPGKTDVTKVEDETQNLSATNPFAKPKADSGESEKNGTAKENGEKKFMQVPDANISQASPMPVESGEMSAEASLGTLKQYLWSILYMPNSMRVLCLCNLFCWMSLVCYSLYFTDFVGEAVFGGNPQANVGSRERVLYDEGVRFGCWGMACYSMSCAIYSFCVEKLVKKFRAKPVYVGGQLVYCVGMIFMALTRTKWGVLFFSWSAGIMYSTLFTMPYIIVAHYHETNTYSEDRKQEEIPRGMGTDVGIVSSMVFLAQFILSISMGSIISTFQSTTAVIVAASVLSACGSITASFVTYLDL